MVRRVWPNQTITLVAGNSTGGSFFGDGEAAFHDVLGGSVALWAFAPRCSGGPATLATLTSPQSVAISSDTVTGGGSIFIAGAHTASQRVAFRLAPTSLFSLQMPPRFAR